MVVNGTSLIYVDECEGNDWQVDMRVIVRTNIDDNVAIELSNDSLARSGIQDENLFAVECTPDEAREIAAALILAAETAEKQQEETDDAEAK